MNSIRKLWERCWSAASQLDAVSVRNKDMPQAYHDTAVQAFMSLRALESATDGREDGPWRISGTTEDERMLKLSNRHGAVVAHVYGDEAAHLLMAVSELWSKEGD